MISFLRQLPEKAYFNVVSFGSNYDYMYTTSQAQYAIDDAITKIETYTADHGGTEILKPISDIISKPIKQGYQRFVYLLTDGDVSNGDEIVAEVS